MAVIINDFEVVVEPPPSTTKPATGTQPQEQAQTQNPAPRPLDIEHINRHFEKRRARLIAN